MGPEEIHSLFTELGVLRTGHFELSSGVHSDTYVQCARALQHPRTARRLGEALAERTKHIDADVVASPAVGGVLAGFVVADALDRRFIFAERYGGEMVFRRGQGPELGERVLLVEDVVTTGGSAMEVAARCQSAGASAVGLASLVDRSGALAADARPALPPVALLQLAPQVWEPDACPQCRDGRALDRPGSRPG